MNFPEAENYLFSLGNEVETMKLGLDNIRTLLDALGNPQNNYKKVQVAGTNGKGSVCAFLDSICVHAGIKTGLYTSPHLVSIIERVKIDGVDISEEDFARLATRVRETSEKLVDGGRLERVPTFFEQVTAIALLAFAESNVELAILETGLGGRLDATTAANAEIAVITRIDLDHQEYLGETIEKIAAEKAAIIRENSKVVIGQQSKEAERVILGLCREVGVDPTHSTSDIFTRLHGDPSYPIYTHTFRTRRRAYPNIDAALLGRHQAENGATAIGVVELLQEDGFRISDQDVWIGMENALHPGRIEFYGGFLLDGAHNVSGAQALKTFIEDFVSRPITLIFGVMKRKSASEIAEILFPLAENIVLTQPENTRAFTAEDLEKLIASVSSDVANITKTKSVNAAIETARKMSSPNGLILVTGSLFLVGEVKKLLKDEQAV